MKPRRNGGRVHRAFKSLGADGRKRTDDDGRKAAENAARTYKTDKNREIGHR